MEELFYAAMDVGARDFEPYKILVYYTCAIFIFQAFLFLLLWFLYSATYHFLT